MSTPHITPKQDAVWALEIGVHHCETTAAALRALAGLTYSTSSQQSTLELVDRENLANLLTVLADRLDAQLTTLTGTVNQVRALQ